MKVLLESNYFKHPTFMIVLMETNYFKHPTFMIVLMETDNFKHPMKHELSMNVNYILFS